MVSVLYYELLLPLTREVPCIVEFGHFVDELSVRLALVYLCRVCVSKITTDLVDISHCEQ